VGAASRVCPFSGAAASEDELGRELFPKAHGDAAIGRFLTCYTGYVNDPSLRARGSSGGLGRWLACELLRRGLVDAVVHVAEESGGAREGGPLHRYCVARTVDEVLAASRSAYYPVQMADVLDYVRRTPGRYAFTGVPCFVKGLRLLARAEPLFAKRIAFTIGLVCGHLKSARYAELLGWQLGVSPGDLGKIDFREKIGARANEKGVVVADRAGRRPPPRTTPHLFGADYNLGFFQYQACDFCDDVFAELADVSVGDAWLPEFISDPAGTSIVVARNATIGRIIEDARLRGELAVVEAAPARLRTSQRGGLRHRREGLSYRLDQCDRAGRWRPPKRVRPSRLRLRPQRRKIYQARARLREVSHEAFQEARRAGNLSQFREQMVPLVRQYRSLYRPGWPRRARRGVERRLRALSGWLKRVVQGRLR